MRNVSHKYSSRLHDHDSTHDLVPADMPVQHRTNKTTTQYATAEEQLEACGAPETPIDDTIQDQAGENNLGVCNLDESCHGINPHQTGYDAHKSVDEPEKKQG